MAWKQLLRPLEVVCMKDAPVHRGCEHATCRGLLFCTMHQSPTQPPPRTHVVCRQVFCAL